MTEGEENIILHERDFKYCNSKIKIPSEKSYNPIKSKNIVALVHYGFSTPERTFVQTKRMVLIK